MKSNLPRFIWVAVFPDGSRETCRTSDEARKLSAAFPRLAAPPVSFVEYRLSQGKYVPVPAAYRLVRA